MIFLKGYYKIDKLPSHVIKGIKEDNVFSSIKTVLLSHTSVKLVLNNLHFLDQYQISMSLRILDFLDCFFSSFSLCTDLIHSQFMRK